MFSFKNNVKYLQQITVTPYKINPCFFVFPCGDMAFLHLAISFTWNKILVKIMLSWKSKARLISIFFPPTPLTLSPFLIKAWVMFSWAGDSVLHVCFVSYRMETILIWRFRLIHEKKQPVTYVSTEWFKEKSCSVLLSKDIAGLPYLSSRELGTCNMYLLWK